MKLDLERVYSAAINSGIYIADGARYIAHNIKGHNALLVALEAFHEELDLSIKRDEMFAQWDDLENALAEALEEHSQSAEVQEAVLGILDTKFGVDTAKNRYELCRSIIDISTNQLFDGLNEDQEEFTETIQNKLITNHGEFIYEWAAEFKDRAQEPGEDAESKVDCLIYGLRLSEFLISNIGKNHDLVNKTSVLAADLSQGILEQKIISFEDYGAFDKLLLNVDFYGSSSSKEVSERISELYTQCEEQQVQRFPPIYATDRLENSEAQFPPLYTADPAEANELS